MNSGSVDTTTLKVTMAVAGTIAALGAAWKVCASVVRAAFDNAVMAAVKRKTPELERHMRQRIFADELKRGIETRTLAEDAVRICRENAKAIGSLATRQEDIVETLAELKAVPSMLDSIGQELAGLRSSVDYMHGVVDQMRTGGVALPPGAGLPGTAPGVPR
jgi:hypothetical protein